MLKESKKNLKKGESIKEIRFPLGNQSFNSYQHKNKVYKVKICIISLILKKTEEGKKMWFLGMGRLEK